MSFICAGVNSLVRMILMSLEFSPRTPVSMASDVLVRRAVARFATDARLGPGGVVGVAAEVVVGRQLADVAIEAGGVEGEHAVGPGEGLVARGSGKCRTPLAAVSYQVLLVDVVGHGQDLQSALGHWREEVVDVLASHDVGDRVAVSLPSPCWRTQPAAARFPRGIVCPPITTSAICGLEFLRRSGV